MSYSPQEHNEFLSGEEVRISKEISICQQVKETVDTKGWQEIIGPLIDRYIIDVTGGKVNGTWIGGKLDRARSDERREYWIGFKQALIEIHGRIMFHLDHLKLLEDQLKSVQKDKEERYRIPLVNDTRYGREDAIIEG